MHNIIAEYPSANFTLIRVYTIGESRAKRGVHCSVLYTYKPIIDILLNYQYPTHFSICHPFLDNNKKGFLILKKILYLINFI